MCVCVRAWYLSACLPGRLQLAVVAIKYYLLRVIIMAYSDVPLVGIIMGSGSDGRIMKGAAETLDMFGIKHEDQIVSAHRTPDRLSEYARHAEKAGFKVIIAGAGGAAHLPGMIASHTVIPVIGVPILVYNDKRSDNPNSDFSAFGGLDSLLSITEMPSGSPVVSVGINKAGNAGIYAAKILANEFPVLQEAVRRHKAEQHDSVVRLSEQMRSAGLSEFVRNQKSS